VAAEREREVQLEVARIEAGPDELLASEQRPSPVGPMGMMAAAAALALGFGRIIRRRPTRQLITESVTSSSSSDTSPPDDSRLWLRRARNQR